MRGRDADQARRGLQRAAGDHGEALVVDRHGDHPGAGGAQHGPGGRVARLLHPDRVARIDQHAGGEVERLLRAGSDDHLVGPAEHGARHGEIVGDGLAQGAVAAGLAADQEGALWPPPAACEQPRPVAERELVELRQAGRERPRPRAVMPEPHQHGAARRDAAMRRARGAGQPAPGRRLVRQVGRDERAGADPAVDVALGAQLLERRHHGVARYAKIASQRAGGRQARARLQAALQDRLADREVDLAMQGPARRRVDRQRREGQVARVLGHLMSKLAP